MAGIEFLDTDGDTDGDTNDLAGKDLDSQAPHEPHTTHEPQTTPATRHDSVELLASWPAPAASVLFVIAAVLTVLAAFRDVFSVSFGTKFNRQSESIDGWGRIHDLTNATPAAEHGTRYGIVLCVVAAVLVGAAALSLVPRTRTVARNPALLGTGLLAGVLAAATLEAQSNFDNLRAQLKLEQLDQADPTPIGNVQTTYGWAIWLGIIALVGALLALALPLAVALVQRRSARRQALQAAEPLPASVHPDDEVLSGAPNRDEPDAG